LNLDFVPSAYEFQGECQAKAEAKIRHRQGVSCALRSDRPKRRRTFLRTSVSSGRRAQNHSDAKPDDNVQNTVSRLSGLAESRAKNGDADRAADIVPTL
jgi:hypothetical protein